MGPTSLPLAAAVCSRSSVHPEPRYPCHSARAPCLQRRPLMEQRVRAPRRTEVAATYYRVLLRHTRWSETQWDEARGHYTGQGLRVRRGARQRRAAHPGRLRRASAPASTRTRCGRRTLATIQHFAASNRLTGGTEWGRTLFFDTTFQLYFVLAARLLWDDLDDATRATNVDTIVREQAAYTTALGHRRRPASGSWTPNGLGGRPRRRHQAGGDGRLRAVPRARAGLGAGRRAARRVGQWYGPGRRNEAGLPAGGPGQPGPSSTASRSRGNTARNLYDTFIVENHGSFGPHYQAELWRTSGRNAAHFIAAGRPMPEVLTAQPNADQLWRHPAG